jgi:hypothetical protein
VNPKWAVRIGCPDTFGIVPLSSALVYLYSHFVLDLQSSSVRSTILDITLDALAGRRHDHSSSRPGPGADSTSFAWVSFASVGERPDLTIASSFTSAAAALARMRPSSASLRVKRAISESYCSHSGICRARASLGSFCVQSSTTYSV